MNADREYIQNMHCSDRVHSDVGYWLWVADNGSEDDLKGAVDFSCYSSP
jgi:hypothetical protein